MITTPVPMIGQLLVERNLIGEWQLAEALAEHKQRGARLGEHLLDKQVISMRQLNAVLFEQFRLKIIASVLALGSTLFSTLVSGDARNSPLVTVGKVVSTNYISHEDTVKTKRNARYKVILKTQRVDPSTSMVLMRGDIKAEKMPYHLSRENHEVYFISGDMDMENSPAFSENGNALTKEVLISPDLLDTVSGYNIPENLSFIIVSRQSQQQQKEQVSSLSA